MSSDPKNVVAVHCKGGKGRTGTMICILLVEHGLFEDAVSRSVIKYIESCHGTVAQLVERPSKVPVLCNSTALASNHKRDMSTLVV